MPGFFGQGFECHKKRIYLLSDGVFFSFPSKKLGFTEADKKNMSSLSKNDFKYTVFNTKREFEGIRILKNGKIYILLTSYPELISN